MFSGLKQPGKIFVVFSLLSMAVASPLVAAQTAEASVTLKKKVAIARFSNETRSGQSFLVDGNNDRIGKQASDILAARLAETGKFLMFERIDADKTSAEATLSNLEESGIPVDYLIIGSVSEFGRSTDGQVGVFSKSKAQRAYAKVNVRLIEVKTGRVISAREGAGEATTETKQGVFGGSTAGYDQSLNDKAISAAISQLISNLVEEMTAVPWKSFFLAEEEGSYIISGGASQGLTPGLELQVYSAGRKIKNPQTGAMIQLPGKRVGSVTVDMSFGDDEFNEVSYVSLTSGALNDDLSKYEIKLK